jgi:hypothetical protein
MTGWFRRAERDIGVNGVLRPSRDVLTAFRDGAAVLLDLRREVYLTLDEAGAIIWQELERGTPVDRIPDRLAAEFDAPVELLRADTERFLGELARRGLAVPS